MLYFPFNLALKVPINGTLLKSLSVSFCRALAASGPCKAIKAKLSSSLTFTFKFYFDIILLMCYISMYLFPALTTIRTSSSFYKLAAIASSIIPASSVKNMVR